MSNHTHLPEGMRSESSGGHKRTLIAPREWIGVRANTTVRWQVEEGIVVTTIVVLPTGPTLVRLVAGVFS